MGIIARNEAAHRLRILASQANRGVSAARNGDWREAFDAAYEMREALNKLIPHLEEAADAVAAGVMPESFADADAAPPIDYSEPKRTGGGMGYRGGAGNRVGYTTYSSGGYAPIKRDESGNWTRETTEERCPNCKRFPKEEGHEGWCPRAHEPKAFTVKTRPRYDSSFNAPSRDKVERSTADPIWNPLSDMIDDIKRMAAEREAPAEPQPIVTPPPPVEKIYAFDLRRIPGMSEYEQAFATSGPLNDEEREAAEAFKLLAPEMRDKIIARYRSTCAPVKVRVKK
jgi:hypothetical protein